LNCRVFSEHFVCSLPNVCCLVSCLVCTTLLNLCCVSCRRACPHITVYLLLPPCRVGLQRLKQTQKCHSCNITSKGTNLIPTCKNLATWPEARYGGHKRMLIWSGVILSAYSKPLRLTGLSFDIHFNFDFRLMDWLHHGKFLQE